MDDITLKFQLASLLGSIPWLIVMLIGGVACLLRLSTRPREGWLVGAAIGVALFAAFGVSIVVGLVFRHLPIFGVEPAWVFTLVYITPTAILQAVSWGLLLYVAFGEKTRSRSKYLIEDHAERNQP